MTGVALERARSAPAVDEAVFSQLVADLGAQHIEAVCRLFLENAASGIVAVRQALDADDAAAAAEAAHRLKSASGFLGATRLADLCAAVEAGSAAGTAAAALAAELRRTSDDLLVLVARVAGAGT
jgi:HPt (histidine-containing phosphotransfer) domain-containing protein